MRLWVGLYGWVCMGRTVYAFTLGGAKCPMLYQYVKLKYIVVIGYIGYCLRLICPRSRYSCCVYLHQYSI